MVHNFDWIRVENHHVNVLLMMDQPFIPEESLFLPCVSDLPNDNINKIIIYADNTTPYYKFDKLSEYWPTV